MGSDTGEGDRLFLLSRFVPSWGEFSASGLVEGPVQASDGTTIGWFSPTGTPAPTEAFLLEPEFSRGKGTGTLSGRLLSRVWELLTENPEQISRDIRALFDRPRRPQLPDGAFSLGGGTLAIDHTAAIEPGTVFDTTGGPIWIDRNARVRAFKRLAGPAYVGPGSTLLGGTLESVSIGPVCRIRGEFAESVCLGYVNKQHDGHIGHAYLGRWVNLGAETTNSDLKNNYGTVRLWTPEGETDTGTIKMGTLIGDHVKTGIGLLLNTGTVIGAGSNIFGSTMPDKYVPPFSWGEGENLSEYRLDRFLEVAERAMSRRDVVLEESQRMQLTRAWERGRGIGRLPA
jgi:UDP-N-acetylglucosamine diphosphorylase/glucosamine-1-phosphate N-acetyltransferase